MEIKRHGDDSDQYFDFSWGERSVRLRHATRVFRINNNLDFNDLIGQIGISDKTLIAGEKLRHTLMRRGTFATIAEGMGMTAEELQALTDSNAPLAPICPAKLMLASHVLVLNQALKDELSSKMHEHLRLNGLNQKQAAQSMGVGDHLIRNILRKLQKRLSRDNLERLARMFGTDCLTLVRGTLT